MDGLDSAFQEAIKDIKRLYDSDVPIEERKMILAARKELNRLHGLYVRTAGETADEAADKRTAEEIEEVRRHLEPLGLAPEGTPAAELARLAVVEIMKK
ncbi:MAG: hypothetical protein FWE67_15420 [Planctomycetaceae bacterium]|nr:hypothetical protein [Planctomycetaceae bacterium]